MKHWLVTGPRRIECREDPIPVPGPGQVRVRVTHTALSPGSNLHVYRTGTYKPIWDGEPAEALYMASGVIEAVGSHVNLLRIGEPVAANGIGHQEFAVIDAAKAHRVPDGASLRDASLAYLSAWSISALHLTGYAAAETVIVIGCGLVGASAALVADLMGARVLAVDSDLQRIEFAATLGLGAVAWTGAHDFIEIEHEFSGNTGPDLILETSGAWDGTRLAITIARHHTRIGMMGIYRAPLPEELREAFFNELFGFPSKFHYNRLRFIGIGSDPETIAEPMPRMATRDRNFAYVLEQAARGRLRLDTLVTSTVSAEEIGSVLARLDQGDRREIGVVFEWP